jgi:hypothetical protein
MATLESLLISCDGEDLGDSVGIGDEKSPGPTHASGSELGEVRVAAGKSCLIAIVASSMELGELGGELAGGGEPCGVVASRSLLATRSTASSTGNDFLLTVLPCFVLTRPKRSLREEKRVAKAVLNPTPKLDRATAGADDDLRAADEDG